MHINSKMAYKRIFVYPTTALEVLYTHIYMQNHLQST